MSEMLKNKRLIITLLVITLLMFFILPVSGTFAELDEVTIVYWEHHGPGNNAGLRYLWFFQDAEPYDIDPGKNMGGIGRFGEEEWYIIGAGDLNENGIADIAWYNVENGLIYYWLMDGTEKISGKGIGFASTGWEAEAVADMNGNGSLDIVLRHEDGRLGVWWLDGVEFDGYTVLESPVNTSMEIAAVADMDDDGIADVIWQDYQGNFEVWFMDFVEDELTVKDEQKPLWNPGGPGWQIAAAADFNGNGSNDLFWQQLDEEHDNFGLRFIWYMEALERVGTKGLGIVDDAAWNLVAVANSLVEPYPDRIIYESKDDIDPVAVEIGTSEEEVIGDLPGSITIYGTEGEEAEGFLDDWTIEGYSATTPGDYIASAFIRAPLVWTGVPVQATTTVTVLEEYTLTLVQTPVTANATLTGAGDYIQGYEVDINAENPDPGYEFSNWIRNPVVGTINNHEEADTLYTMPDQAVTLTANFNAGGVDNASAIDIAQNATSTTWTFEITAVKLDSGQTVTIDLREALHNDLEYSFAATDYIVANFNVDAANAQVADNQEVVLTATSDIAAGTTVTVEVTGMTAAGEATTGKTVTFTRNDTGESDSDTFDITG